MNILSLREREVLLLAVEGNGNPEIAEKQFISPRTLKTHRTNLLRKLGLQSQNRPRAIRHPIGLSSA